MMPGASAGPSPDFDSRSGRNTDWKSLFQSIFGLERFGFFKRQNACAKDTAAGTKLDAYRYRPGRVVVQSWTFAGTKLDRFFL